MPPINSTSRANALLERLRGRFLPEAFDAGARENVPRRRGIAIALCLLISFLLWFTFTMQEVYTVRLTVPTRVVDLSEERALVQLPPRRLEVDVQGEGFQLLQLYYDPPVITIDATNEQVDLQNLVALELSQSVRLQGVQPPTIRLEKDQRIERTVPVWLRGTLETPLTHDFLYAPRIEPDSVRISGARSVVNSIRYWPTQPVQRDNVKDSVTFQVALKDTLQGLVSYFPQQVTVTAVATQFTEATREIDVTVRGIPSTEDQVTLEPRTIRVRYRVPLSQYAEAQRAMDFFAEVTYEQILNDTSGRIEPKLNLPADLQIKDATMIPSSLRYYHIRTGE